jgi:hypothetical protein
MHRNTGPEKMRDMRVSQSVERDRHPGCPRLFGEGFRQRYGPVEVILRETGSTEWKPMAAFGSD